jgi:diguanylate cyclase (GGDEF)-like protein/PAS domain S-box-containing protein
VWLDDQGKLTPTDRRALEAMRDRLVKSQAPAALIEIAVLVMVLSTVNFLLRPEYYPYFHVLDFAAALVMLVIGWWLRRPSVEARWAPWGFTVGMVVLAAALLVQLTVAPDSGPAYVLIVLCILGPVSLAWGPFIAGATVITVGVALTATIALEDAVVDWAFVAVTASAAGAVLLQLRMRSIRAELVAMRSLAEENQRMELVLESSRLGLWDWDMTTGRILCDGRWADILGYQLEDLASLDIARVLDLIHTEDRAAAESLLDDHRQGKAPYYDVELRVQHRDGHWVWVHNRGTIVERTPDGRALRMTGTLEDVTERRALRESMAEAQRIAHVGSWQLDLATGQMAWSEELLRMFGLDLTGPMPTLADSERLFTPQSWQRLTAAIARVAESGRQDEVELQVLKGDGTSAWLQVRGEGVRDTSGAVVGLRGVALDITARKLASDELRHMATHDPLTGLANRTAVNDEITLALRAGRRRGRTTAVLMIDLDHFKDVNDTLGHAAGDQLLVAAADRLENLVRAGDLVSRTGGDEFVVVMRDLDDPQEAVQVARRVVAGFREPFIAPGAELFATATVGVATSSDSSDADDLIREADTAMYVAKEQGRDRMSVFNEGLREVAAARLQVEVDLRHALQRGQLEVWYQPEIELATGRMVAVEALLRWHHPDGTTWTADRFVDVAERTGMILDVGDWVLREACTQAAAWAVVRPDPALTVRVNVSTLQLAEAGLLGAIDDAINASGLDPASLCLEITETALLHQTATAASNLTGIRDRGITIAIDDFGTGYASLTYLREYPIDVLKIDRSFVTHIATHDRDTRIVDGIIALARALGLDVTAEGVENAEQAHLLRRMGCASAQGYLFSRAVPSDQIGRDLHRTYQHD